MDVALVSGSLIFLYLYNLKKQNAVEAVKDGNTFLLDDIEYKEEKFQNLDNSNDYILNSLDWSKVEHKKGPLDFWTTYVPSKLNRLRVSTFPGYKTRNDFLK